jgi:hypothetical protein
MKSPLLLAPEDEGHGKKRSFDLRAAAFVHCLIGAGMILLGGLGHLIGLIVHFAFGIPTRDFVGPANVLLFAGTMSSAESAGFMGLCLLLPEWMSKKDLGGVGMALASVIYLAAYLVPLPLFLASPLLVAGARQ